MMTHHPTIFASDFTGSECQYIPFINTSLYDLGHRCREFNAALALYDFCDSEVSKGGHSDKQMELYWQWSFMAAREAVGAIYRFEEDADILSANTNKCPTLIARIDHNAKRDASRLFKMSFQGFEDLRNSTHHGGVIFQSPEKERVHTTGGPLFAINCLVGRTLQTTFKKRVVSLEISQDSAAKLEAVRDQYWNAFWPLDYRGKMLNSLFSSLQFCEATGQMPREDKSDLR